MASSNNIHSTLVGLLMLALIVSVAHGYGTLFANSVLPYKNADTHVTRVSSDFFSTNSLSAERIDAHNPQGFAVNTKGPISVSSASANLAASLGVTLAANTRASVLSGGSITLESARIDLDASQSTSLSSTAGALNLQAERRLFAQAGNITSTTLNGGVNIEASTEDVNIQGGGGFSFHSKSVIVTAEDRLLFTSTLSQVALQTNGAFSLLSNLVDTTVQRGAEIVSDKDISVVAYAVVDANGGIVQVDAEDSILLESRQKNVNIDAATSAFLSAGRGLNIKTNRGAYFTTYGSSESHVDFTFTDIIDVTASNTVTLQARLPGSDVIINSDSTTTLSGDKFTLTTNKIDVVVQNFDVKSAQKLNIQSSSNDVVVNAGKQILLNTVTSGSVLVNANDDIHFTASNMNVNSGNQIVFTSAADGTLAATDNSGVLSSQSSGATTIGGSALVVEAGVLSVRAVGGGALSVVADAATIKSGPAYNIALTAPTVKYNFPNTATMTGSNLQLLADQALSISTTNAGGVISLTATGTDFGISSKSKVTLTSTTALTLSSARNAAFVSGSETYSVNTFKQTANDDFSLYSGQVTLTAGTQAKYDAGSSLSVNAFDLVQYKSAGANALTVTNAATFSSGTLSVISSGPLSLGVNQLAISSEKPLKIQSTLTSTISASKVKLVSGNDLLVSAPIIAVSAGADLELSGEQLVNIESGASFVKFDAVNVHISSREDGDVLTGGTLSVTSKNAFSLETLGSLTSRADGIITLSSSGASDFTVTGRSALLTADSAAALLAITNTNPTGIFQVTASGVDAAVRTRVGTDQTITVKSLQSFVANNIYFRSNIDGSTQLRSTNELTVTATSAISTTGNTVDYVSFLGTTINGGKVLYSADILKSIAAKNTKFNAATEYTATGRTNALLADGTDTITTGQWTVSASEDVRIASTAAAEYKATTDVTLTSGGKLHLTGGATTNTIKSTLTDTTFNAGRTVQVLGTAATSDFTFTMDTANAQKVFIHSDDGSVDLRGKNLLVKAYDTADTGNIIATVSGNVLGVAEGGLSITSSAKDTSNLAIVLKTTHREGDIVLHSLGSDVVFETAKGQIVVSSGDTNELRASDEIINTATTATTLKATTGGAHVSAVGGFDIRAGTTANNALSVTSTGATTLQAEDRVSFTSTGTGVAANAVELSINAVQGNLRFVTSDAKDIRTTVGTDASYTATAGNIEVLAGESVAFSSTLGNSEVLAKTDLVVTTIGGPLAVDATTNNGSPINIVAGGNFTVKSGDDLVVDAALDLTVSAGSTFESTAVTGNLAVVAPAGSVSFTNQQGNLLQLYADGERASPRDGVLIDSNKAVVLRVLETNAAGTLEFNAEDLFQIGAERRSDVTFYAGGSANQLGFDLNSDGNILAQSTSTLSFKSAQTLTAVGRRAFDVQSLNSITLTANGLPAQSTRNLDLKSQIGNVYLYGGDVTSSSTTGRTTLTSAANGIHFVSTSPSASSLVHFKALNGLSLLSKELTIDTTSINADISGLVDWRGLNGVELTTDLGDGGSLAVKAATSLTSRSVGFTALRTTDINGDIVLTTQGGNNDIVLVSQGNSGSTVSLLAGNRASAVATTIALSGATGLTVQADDQKGDDSLGDITISSNNAFATSSFQRTELVGGRSVVIRATADTNNPKVALASSRNIEYSSLDDTLFLTRPGSGGNIRLSTKNGGVRIDTTPKSGGDVRIIADNTVELSAGKEFEWETDGNLIGNVGRDAKFTSTGELSDIGMTFSTHGSGGDLNLRSLSNDVAFSATKQLRFSTGTTTAGATSSIRFVSEATTAITANSALIHTTNAKGNIQFATKYGPASFDGSANIDVSAGNSISLTANGRGFDDKRETPYGILFDSAAGSTSVTGNTVSATGWEGVTVVGSTSASIIANGSAFIDSTGPIAGLNLLASVKAILSAGNDIVVDAVDDAGGVVSIYSSGPVDIKSELDISFTTRGQASNIEFITSPDSAYNADIRMIALEGVTLQGGIRSRIEATDATGTDVELRSNNGGLEFSQFGYSDDGNGMFFRANNGDIRFEATGQGSIGVAAVENLDVSAINSIRLSSTGRTPSDGIQFSAAALILESRGGDLNMVSGGATNLNAQSDVRFSSNGRDGDINFVADRSVTVGGQSTSRLDIHSQRGEVTLTHQNYGNILFNAPITSVHPDGNFGIPFANQRFQKECTLFGEMIRFTGAGYYGSKVTGLSGTKNAGLNFGSLCVCGVNAQWNCITF